MSLDLVLSNPLKFSDEEFETIEHLAATNFTPKNMAIYLGVNFKDFEKEFQNKASKVSFHYNKGILSAAFEIENQLLKNAKSGNITAAQESKKATEKRAFQNHKDRILSEV